MHRQNVFVAVALVITVGVVITAGYGRGWNSLGGLATGGATSTTIASEAKRAPELAKGSWLNSDPITISSLRGRVVLIDFWTFGCYNCRNTLPFVKRWDAQYRGKGLTTVGVHTPEFDTEKKFENVRREVAALDIHYPIVTDDDYATWNAYNIEAWPTVVLLDKAGRVRFTHVGEGSYDETEKEIQMLLEEKTGDEQ